MDWLAPVLILLSVVLIGRAFYLLYVLRRGNRISAAITWFSLLFVVGFWTWRFLLNGSS